MIKLVVYDNHSLGTIHPGSQSIQILCVSKLRGAPWSTSTIEPIYYDKTRTRLASKKDFEAFNVSFEGFEDRTLYEYE